MRIYLAHPLTLRHVLRPLELAFEKRTGIDLHNPFYDGSERGDIDELDKTGKLSRKTTPNEIVEGDLTDIDESDGVVAWIEKTVNSIGTKNEIWHALRTGKPVYIITPDWEKHPWLRYIAEQSGGFIVHDFFEFEDTIVGWGAPDGSDIALRAVSEIRFDLLRLRSVLERTRDAEGSSAEYFIGNVLDSLGALKSEIKKLK